MPNWREDVVLILVVLLLSFPVMVAMAYGLQMALYLPVAYLDFLGWLLDSLLRLLQLPPWRQLVEQLPPRFQLLAVLALLILPFTIPWMLWQAFRPTRRPTRLP